MNYFSMKMKSCVVFMNVYSVNLQFCLCLLIANFVP